MDVRNKLIELKEEKYRNFSIKLIPGCENLLGVRIPILRKLAKDIIKEDYQRFLDSEEIYFEEIMLKGFIINNLKVSNEKKFELIKWYIPKITNWSLCDSFCSSLKIKEEEKEDYFKLIKTYLKSNQVYEIRFAVVTMLGYYIDKKYLKETFKMFDSIKNDDYYVKMAVAWAVSMCYVKYKEETIEYLKNNKLDKWTYNKTLQKICESLKVTKEEKDMIKSMKIK